MALSSEQTQWVDQLPIISMTCTTLHRIEPNISSARQRESTKLTQCDESSCNAFVMERLRSDRGATKDGQLDIGAYHSPLESSKRSGFYR